MSETSNVVSLADARQSRPETGTRSEPVSNPAHVQVLPFRKTARVRHSKAQRIAHLQDERVRIASRARCAERPDWHQRFGQNLRTVREALGISEGEAAAAAGRSVLTWRKYEATGKGRCTHAVFRFAQHYGMTIDDLFPLDVEPPAVADASKAQERCDDSSALLAHNKRLRAQRNDAWIRARAETGYWKAMQSFTLAVHVAQREGMPAARQRHPKTGVEDHAAAYREYRLALLAQLLTPAPDVASVNWKRRELSAKRREHWDAATLGKIQGAIVADEAFLSSHPVRQ